MRLAGSRNDLILSTPLRHLFFTFDRKIWKENYFRREANMNAWSYYNDKIERKPPKTNFLKFRQLHLITWPLSIPANSYDEQFYQWQDNLSLDSTLRRKKFRIIFRNFLVNEKRKGRKKHFLSCVIYFRLKVMYYNSLKKNWQSSVASQKGH